eukprot:6316096-Alexandrium_andersonii.AAC.1
MRSSAKQPPARPHPTHPPQPPECCGHIANERRATAVCDPRTPQPEVCSQPCPDLPQTNGRAGLLEDPRGELGRAAHSAQPQA